MAVDDTVPPVLSCVHCRENIDPVRTTTPEGEHTERIRACDKRIHARTWHIRAFDKRIPACTWRIRACDKRIHA